MVFIFAFITTIVKGWVALIQPIVLSFGAVFAAINLDVELISNIKPIAWRNFLTLKQEKEDKEEIKEQNKEKNMPLDVMIDEMQKTKEKQKA